MSESVRANVRARIEEELGGFRQFANLSAVELEAAAARIARGIEPYLAGGRKGAAEATREL